VGLFSRIFGKKKATCPCCEHKEETVAPVEEEKVVAPVAEEKTEEVATPVVEEVKAAPAKKPAQRYPLFGTDTAVLPVPNTRCALPPKHWPATNLRSGLLW